MRTALTIAGSDPSGGAGLQADLKTFAAHGVFGFSVVTAVTAQNSQTVALTAPIAPEVVVAQIDAVLADFEVHATKIGMLASAAIAGAVAEAIDRHRLAHVVLDPVLRASAGQPLLDAPGVDALRDALLPRVAVVTPNIEEAEALAGREIRNVADMCEAARWLERLGSGAVVITGGHLPGEPIDVVYADGRFTELRGTRLETRHTHGTGCTFSSALAARLALGDDLVEAAREAKAYVERAIRRAPGLGHGRGPLGHF